MIVDRLIPDVHRPGSTRVMVDGRPAWTVASDVIASLHLAEGDVIRGPVFERLDHAADEEAAFRTAMRALERRAHGERELAVKLERKGHPPLAIAAAIERLRELGLLDDRAFARAYVASRAERGRGPVRLRRDLALLGIARATIEEALGELAAGDPDPLARPRALVEKRAAALAGLPAAARRRRLLGFLARRGYRGGEVLGLVETALARPAGSSVSRRGTGRGASAVGTGKDGP